jgi:hypothetical protein
MSQQGFQPQQGFQQQVGFQPQQGFQPSSGSISQDPFQPTPTPSISFVDSYQLQLQLGEKRRQNGTYKRLIVFCKIPAFVFPTKFLGF